MKCVKCGKPAKNWDDSPPAYCDNCLKPRIELPPDPDNCLQCGKKISNDYKWDSGYGEDTEFCSDECYNKYHGF